jgi:stress response protein SCP2
MKIHSTAIRLKPGDGYDLHVRPRRLKIAIGGNAAGGASDLECSFCCAALQRPDQSYIAFIGEERTVMLEGSVRQSENRFSVDEWGDCFIVRLDDIPADITCLIFHGYFTQPPTRDKIGVSIKEHFLRLTDQDSGKEILRVDLPELYAFNSSITYARLSRNSDNNVWHFQFMPSGD